MESQPTPETASQPTISYLSLNDEKPTTIILLHGAGSCHLEFAHVIPHLSEYHLLLPDLPGHSSSRAIKPATIDNAAEHVAALIRSQAHSGKAHIVGMSMGGFIAQRLALQSPDLFLSLFVTGASPFSGWTRWMAERPILITATMGFMIFCLPDFVYWWAASAAGLKRHEELLEEMRGNWSRQTTAEVYGSIVPYSIEDVERLRVRTLVVAGGQQDDVATIAEMGKRLKARAGTDDGSRTVVVKDAVHAWDLQFPDIFATGVLAWVRGEELPVDYEAL